MDPVVIDVSVRYDSRRELAMRWQCNIGKDGRCESFAESYVDAIRLSLKAYWDDVREQARKKSETAKFVGQLLAEEGK